MTVYRDLVPDDRRMAHVNALFGLDFPLRLEPTVYAMATQLSPDYRGGYWHFYALCNSGFYMAVDSPSVFPVCSPNGYEGQLSADGLGITACLFAYSHLSFAGDTAFAGKCAEQYHLLREYVLDHAEAAAILGAID